YHFKIVILFNQVERQQEHLLISIYIICLLVNKLINAGLYHAINKIIEEASIFVDEKIIYLKDQWKPLYLAIKYLYQPEELSKQPSELNSQAFSLVETLTGEAMEF
ncbi:MAG TPA: hypothetical protein VL832_08495, partial [Puia sp.]|nr:hypothetical protein [Puia sp.]